MKDNEIIKAFECCCNGILTDYSLKCSECPLYDTDDCGDVLLVKTLDLLNRQKAAIEKVENRNNFLEIEYKNQGNLFLARINGAKSEAIKEFAEKFEDEMGEDFFNHYPFVLTALDNLAKEMTEVTE